MGKVRGFNAGGGGAVIKSIQRGRFSGSGNLTISAVDLDNSIVIAYMEPNSLPDADDFFAKVRLTAPTTLNFSRVGNLGAMAVSWQVIEFDSAVVESVQSGETAVTGSIETPVVISAIDPLKSFLVMTFETADNSGNKQASFANAFIFDATTIKVHSRLSPTKTVGWYVVEFK